MKQIYLTTLFFLFISVSVSGQKRIGGVHIHPIQLEEKGDSLHLEMEVYVDGKAMNPCQSWTILPYLTTADSTHCVEMPLALVNGKTKARLFKRREKYGNYHLLANYPTYKIDKKRKRDITFRYVCSVPYEIWMDTAALHIRQILGSCANVEQWFVLEDVAQAHLTPYIAYEVQPQLKLIRPEKEIKVLSREGSAYLDFQVGRSEILPDFRRNPQELAKINEVLSQVKNDKDFEISTLYITGYASPEGSWQSNDRLSYEHAQSLQRYIRDRFHIPGPLISAQNVPEDWERLVQMINEGEMSGKYQVLDIIETVSDPDVREARLRVLNGGAPFRYMLNEMFPALRRVEYKVEFTVKEYSLEEAEAIMQKSPEQLNHYELSLLYDNYPEGSAEQEKISDLILRMYAEDRVANSNAAARLLQQGGVEQARRYIEKTNDIPQAYNTLGVYYLMAEDTDQAEAYFNRALQAIGEEVPYTREDIEHNLEELRKKGKICR